MAERPVAIAGGGIAGLAAALALARAGRCVIVHEREIEDRPEGAGLQLSPNAVRHLREWGVLDGLDATAPRRVVVRRGRDAKVLASLPLEDAQARWGAPFLVAHRADLQAALSAAAALEPRVTLCSGSAVTGWREAPSFAIACRGRDQEADALVIADGVHSALRTRLSGDRPVGQGRVAWRALVPAAALPDFAREPASNLWLGTRTHLVHYPLHGGTVVNLVAVVAGDVATQDKIDFWSRPGNAATLLERFRTWSPRVRDLIAAAPDWRIWPLLARPAPSLLSTGRVALVGDAAHPMMPFLAQGAAQAIEDAAALGDAFAHCAAVADALQAYERRRLQRVRRIVKASERQTMIYHLSGPAAAARDVAMRALGARGLRAATDWIYRA